MSDAYTMTNLRNSFRVWSNGPVDQVAPRTDRGEDRMMGAAGSGREDGGQPSPDPLPPHRDLKMEALGQLTAGVAHDFNNLLTVILGNAGALRVSAEARGNSSDVRRATAIEGAAQRGGRLAAQLLAFSRKQVLCPEVVSAYTVLSGLHDLLSRAAGESVQTRLLRDHDLWSCRVDPGQLESAMLNLVFNARDAMPTGGTITISCRNEQVGFEAARKAGGFPGDYVKIDVADTGTGISTDVLGRVFEPFFTTKPIGKGSGLGLAQVHGFAGQSGGWVEISSAIGHGTTVSLLLPRAVASKSDLHSADIAPVTNEAKRHTVLLVEPDPDQMLKIGGALGLAGYQVLEARDAAEATRWLVKNEPVSLLISRTTLPGSRSGIDIATSARRIRSDLCILLMSDVRMDDAMRDLGADGRCEFLSAPYTATDVIRMSEALLRSGSFSVEREQLHSELRQHPPWTQPPDATWQQKPSSPAEHSFAASRPALSSIKPASVRMGVLPLKALGSRHDDGFSLGLAEELTTAFSRFRSISCISPVSVAALAGEAVAGSPRWLDLELDYLLEGSFRQNGNDIRIVIRLVNMHQPGEISWAKRFDSSLSDVLKLQDQIAADIAAEVAPEVLMWEGDKAASRPQVDPTSYGLMLRAIPAIYRLDQTGFQAAGPLLKEALALDGSNAAAHSWLAHWYMLLVGQGWAKNIKRAAQKADELARRAVMLDPGDARGLTVAGHVKAFLYKDAEQGLRLHEQALELNANLALAWCYCGLANSYLGRHNEAIERIQHAQQLSPHDPHGFFYDMAMVMPLLLTSDFKAAAQVGRRAREAHPGLSSTYKGLISALGFLGCRDEAVALRKELTALEPNFSVQEAIRRSPLTRPEDLQRYADGLRLAGCDELVRQPLLSDYWRPIAQGWRQLGRFQRQQD